MPGFWLLTLSGKPAQNVAAYQDSVVDVADGADVHVWFVALEDLPWARNHFISLSFGHSSRTITSAFNVQACRARSHGKAARRTYPIAAVRHD